MDGTTAININLEALRRILTGLVCMAGMGERQACHLTLPRHLRLAVLRLLRPAEAAARRLIIAAARGLSVTLPPRRIRKPKPATAEPFLRRFGIAVVLHASTNLILPHGAMLASGEPRRIALPLFDPSRRVRPSANRRAVPAHAAPRILLPSIVEPHRLPVPPSPDDPVDASRLAQRLASLAAALDDMPKQARRFARWQARQRECAGSGAGSRRSRRISPLRPGRPPGGRLSRFDPGARRRLNIREVDEILAHAHALALHALNPDTS